MESMTTFLTSLRSASSPNVGAQAFNAATASWTVAAFSIGTTPWPLFLQNACNDRHRWQDLIGRQHKSPAKHLTVVRWERIESSTSWPKSIVVKTPLTPVGPRLEPLTPDQHHQANTKGGCRPQNGAKIVLFVEIEEDEIAVVGTTPASPIWTGLLVKTGIDW